MLVVALCALGSFAFCLYIQAVRTHNADKTVEQLLVFLIDDLWLVLDFFVDVSLAKVGKFGKLSRLVVELQLLKHLVVRSQNPAEERFELLFGI